MRLALRLGGTALIVASVLGLTVLGVLLLNPEPVASPFPGALAQRDHSPQQRAAAATNMETSNSVSKGAIDAPPPLQSANPGRGVGLPITHVEIPAISLSADVVP